MCVCAHPCIPACGRDSMSVFGVSVCVCRHIGVYACAHGVCWGQPSLCDRLIKRCMLGWSSVLSPSVVTDLGSAHSPFSPCLSSTMWRSNMQIYRTKEHLRHLILCDRAVDPTGRYLHMLNMKVELSLTKYIPQCQMLLLCFLWFCGMFSCLFSNWIECLSFCLSGTS